MAKHKTQNQSLETRSTNPKPGSGNSKHEKIKQNFEARNPKYETNSNDKNTNILNQTG